MRRRAPRPSRLRCARGESGTTDEEALPRFARALGPKAFVAPPGAVFSYSNPGLALAGAALEAAHQKRYADVMQSLLFTPLGMTRTTLRPAEAALHPRASGHDDKGETVPGYDLDTRMAPAGYAFSTGRDLAAFVREWLAAHGGHGRVLSRSAARLMGTPVADFPPTFDGTGYGHGLFADDRRGVLVLHHGGQTAISPAARPDRRSSCGSAGTRTEHRTCGSSSGRSGGTSRRRRKRAGNRFPTGRAAP